MTVTATRLIDVDLTISTAGKWRATASWTIDTDDDTQGTLDALTEAQTAPYIVPEVGSGYSLEGDSIVGLYLDTLRVRRQISPHRKTKFMATGNYITPEPGTNGPQNSNPILRPPIGWFEFENETVAIQQAYLQTALSGIDNGTIGDLRAVVTAAGKDYDSTLFEDVQTLIWVQQKNVQTIQEVYNIHNAYDLTLNSTDYYGFAKHHAQYRGIRTSQPQEISGVSYYSVEVRVALGRKPFYRDIVNRGLEALKNGKLYTPQRRIDPEDDESRLVPITEPALLKLDGTLLEDKKKGNTILYRTRDEVNYAGLQWVDINPGTNPT